MSRRVKEHHTKECYVNSWLNTELRKIAPIDMRRLYAKFSFVWYCTFSKVLSKEAFIEICKKALIHNNKYHAIQYKIHRQM